MLMKSHKGGTTSYRWTPESLILLCSLREDEDWKWSEIAELFNTTENACIKRHQRTRRAPSKHLAVQPVCNKSDILVVY